MAPLLCVVWRVKHYLLAKPPEPYLVSTMCSGPTRSTCRRIALGQDRVYAGLCRPAGRGNGVGSEVSKIQGYLRLACVLCKSRGDWRVIACALVRTGFGHRLCCSYHRLTTATSATLIFFKCVFISSWRLENVIALQRRETV